MTAIDPIFGPLLFALNATGDCAIAIITRTQGPSYRRAGSVMAIAPDGSRSGSLSSGCIEADIVQHAIRAMADGEAKTLTYGAGSPFIDLRLPCGGAMDILIVPRPDRSVLRTALQGIENRIPQRMPVMIRGRDRDTENSYFLDLKPRLAFAIFGQGAEAEYFAVLAHSLGYAVSVFTPDTEALAGLKSKNIAAHYLKTRESLPDIALDKWTAAVLFFHDHDWEPVILAHVLDSDAFYIGAQGSHLARQNRDAALAEQGISPDSIGRITGPIGLIPSTRDPRSLAVSVLAEVLALAQEQGV